MVKCPFCQFENEDGALFCEQCKSDLSSAENATPPTPPPPVLPSAEPLTFETAALHVAEPILQAAPILPEAMPFAAEMPAAPPVEAPAPPPVVEAPASVPVLAPGDAPKLVVIRGLKVNAEYPLYEGENFIGRVDEKPVDVDLEDQEPPDRIWSSRQHAVIILAQGKMTIEDLNSANGTFVNRTRVYPGQRRDLAVNDVIQIGTVQMRVKV